MLGEMCTAIADPTRRRILELLAVGDLSAGQIAEHFNLTKATLSHHLAVLRDDGLVTSERDGTRIIYHLNTTILQELVAWIYSVTDMDHEESNRNKFNRGDEGGEGSEGAEVHEGLRSDNDEKDGSKHGQAL